MSRAAIRYAKAILDIASANTNAEAVNNDMVAIINSISESKELQNFLGNPVITSSAKNNALLEVFASSQKETKSLFQLLQENKRFEILFQIAQQYKTLFDEVKGVEVATVTTAFPITPELETQVLEKTKQFTTKSVTINNIVDESIIGGFILRIGDQQYNASVANKLQNLKREFSN
jgi:F-type H+-transporting ATPase subunit delta